MFFVSLLSVSSFMKSKINVFHHFMNLYRVRIIIMGFLTHFISHRTSYANILEDSLIEDLQNYFFLKEDTDNIHQ
jgi:hypothetical protein